MTINTDTLEMLVEHSECMYSVLDESPAVGDEMFVLPLVWEDVTAISPVCESWVGLTK